MLPERWNESLGWHRDQDTWPSRAVGLSAAEGGAVRLWGAGGPFLGEGMACG